MTDPHPYSDRFSFGRMFIDIGRVMSRAWLSLTIGIALLAVAPIVATSLPWSEGRTDDPAFLQILVAVAIAKTATNLLFLAAMSVLTTLLSLRALTALSSRELFSWRGVSEGFLTALCVGLLVNWPILLAPMLFFFPSFYPIGEITWLAILVSQLLVSVSVSVAVSAAVAEKASVVGALARSCSLLRGLRWRFAAFGLALLFAIFIGQYVIVLGLRHRHRGCSDRIGSRAGWHWRRADRHAVSDRLRFSLSASPASFRRTGCGRA
jgi:hypothetical protein